MDVIRYLVAEISEKKLLQITRGSVHVLAQAQALWIRRPWGFLICSFGACPQGAIFPFVFPTKIFSLMYRAPRISTWVAYVCKQGSGTWARLYASLSS